MTMTDTKELLVIIKAKELVKHKMGVCKCR